jgi:hypothetical protein
MDFHTWSLTSLCILRVDLEYIQQGLGPSLLVTNNLDLELKITPEKEIQQRRGNKEQTIVHKRVCIPSYDPQGMD